MDLENNGGAIPILGKKPRLCNICGKNYHPFDVRCAYGNLVERVRQLLHANAAILATNKEVTELANTYQKLAKDTAMALVICEKTVMEFENGTQIWKRFQEKLTEAGFMKTNISGGEPSAKEEISRISGVDKHEEQMQEDKEV